MARASTLEQYDVMRGHGTERPGSCALNHEKRRGAFNCAGCGQPLFRSGEKFSGTGWPSFFDPLPGALGSTVDRSYGMVRTEVHCSRCGSHLGMSSTMARRRPACAIASMASRSIFSQSRRQKTIGPRDRPIGVKAATLTATNFF
jgi:methionine-R-sulfoxide reductase